MSLPIESYCPRCDAVPGQCCVGSRGQERRAFHRGRGSRRAAAPTWSPHLHKVESPLEDDLAGAITAWIDYHNADASVATQVPLGPYRLDMVVASGNRRLVVEADGAAFHNSPDMIEHDKRRDRFCVTQGYSVMRFTGAEIRRDPRGCAAQVGLWIRARG